MQRSCLGFLFGYIWLLSSLDMPVVQAATLEWRGFFTTGVAFSDAKTPYYMGISKKARVAEETFLGLNLNKDLTQEWRVAAQFLARSGQADGAAKVDWAFAAYEPNSSYSVTLGKQKIPMWMMSSYLDVGRAYPWVVPPEEVYTLFDLRSFTGIAGSYAFPLGESTLIIRPYGGDVYLESSPNSPGVNSKFRASNMWGSSIEWTHGKNMLRVAYNRALWNFSTNPLLQYGERNYTLATIGGRVEAKGFSLLTEYVYTYDEDNKRFQKEAGQLEVQAAAAKAAHDDANAAALAARANLLRLQIAGSHAYYATLSKQFESYLLHLTYAAVTRPVFDYLTRDQRSIALGMNYDVNVDSVIKLEAKRVFVPKGSQGIFDAVPNDAEAMIYRIGYSMIF